MFGTVPPIPPPPGTSTGNPSNPNVNRVDTMPNTETTNTSPTINVSRSVDDDLLLPQLLDSRGRSHITNVPAFDKDDFTSWKIRFLVFLDGLEPYLIITLEDGLFVPMSNLSTPANPLPKRQNQWSTTESRLANQDKRLKSIIIGNDIKPFVPMSNLSTPANPLPKRQNQWSNTESHLSNQDKRLKSIIIGYLPNDVMKSVIKYKSAKEMWTELCLAYEGPSDTRDTKIAALRLKFNAFKALDGEKVNGTYTQLKCLLNDLENNGRANNSIKNDSLAALYGKYHYEEVTQMLKKTTEPTMNSWHAEYHETALLANQKRFYKRSKRVGSARKPMDKSKETCFACGKPGKYKGLKAKMAVLSQSIDEPTKGKNDKGKGNKGKSDKGLIAELFDWNDESVSSEDEGTTKFKAFMAIAEDEPSVGKGDARSGQ
ncbi:hypothetical protein Tco_0326610 [Tanacetum coccineum]